jgi:hypothetical protein
MLLTLLTTEIELLLTEDFCKLLTDSFLTITVWLYGLDSKGFKLFKLLRLRVKVLVSDKSSLNLDID